MPEDDPWREIDRLIGEDRLKEAQEIFVRDWDRHNEATIAEFHRENGTSAGGHGEEIFSSVVGYIGECLAPIVIRERRTTRRIVAVEKGGALAEQVKALEARVAAVEKSGASGFRYRQIWSEDQSYVPGDFVTFSGSMWACIRETQDRPGSSADCGWKLCVKSVRGRDGRDHDAEIRELTRRLDALEMRRK